MAYLWWGAVISLKGQEASRPGLPLAVTLRGPTWAPVSQLQPLTDKSRGADPRVGAGVMAMAILRGDSHAQGTRGSSVVVVKPE